MIIKKKRIRSLMKYLKDFSDSSEVCVYVEADENNKNILIKNGIISEYIEGKSIVPLNIGPVTRYNLKGKEIIYKNREKEKRIIERAFHIVDWHGQDHYGTCFPILTCFPKEFILPPLETITFKDNYIHSRKINIQEKESIKHIINMFLEIFGNCIISEDIGQMMHQNIEIKTVQWKLLPPGKYPWERAEKELTNYFNKIPSNKKNVIENRHKIITRKTPDFMAIGEDSFNGYVVYGYIEKNIYIFESNEVNNATYIFKGEWENASKLTKREIISGELCHKRLVHNQEWEKTILSLLEMTLL